jgi:AcrR family transcriptional regulator
MQRRKSLKTDNKPRVRLATDERRAQLLALGIGLFASRPYDEISIDELARSAGISKGLLYHYFPTKRDFYVAAIGEAARQLLEETVLVETLPIPERAIKGLEAYLGFVEARGPAYVALMRGGIGSDPEVGGIVERTRGVFFERMVAGVPSELATPLVRAAFRGYIGFVEAAALDWIERRELPREKLIELCTSALGAVLRLASDGALDI